MGVRVEQYTIHWHSLWRCSPEADDGAHLAKDLNELFLGHVVGNIAHWRTEQAVEDQLFASPCTTKIPPLAHSPNTTRDPLCGPDMLSLCCFQCVVQTVQT